MNKIKNIYTNKAVPSLNVFRIVRKSETKFQDGL